MKKKSGYLYNPDAETMMKLRVITVMEETTIKKVLDKLINQEAEKYIMPENK